MKYWENGFYLEQNASNTRLAISDEYWAELLEKQSKGYSIKLINGQLKAVENTLTESEKIDIRITELKMLLAQTDYKAIKYAEGEISEIDYAETKAQRREWRAEINRLGG